MPDSSGSAIPSVLSLGDTNSPGIQEPLPRACPNCGGPPGTEGQNRVFKQFTSGWILGMFQAGMFPFLSSPGANSSFFLSSPRLDLQMPCRSHPPRGRGIGNDTFCQGGSTAFGIFGR